MKDIWTHADVSRTEHLLLRFDVKRYDIQTDYGHIRLSYDELGIALSRRDFCNVKTLIVLVDGKQFYDCRTGYLADATRGPGLINLRTLWLPGVRFLVVNALAELCVLSQLTSLHVDLLNSGAVILKTFLKRGRLTSLQCLRLTIGFIDDEDDGNIILFTMFGRF